VNATLNDSDLKSKAIMKTQFKRDAYRVLGPSTNVDDEYDPNLYNDHDLY
jgi:hypothetical protein